MKKRHARAWARLGGISVKDRAEEGKGRFVAGTGQLKIVLCNEHAEPTGCVLASRLSPQNAVCLHAGNAGLWRQGGADS